MIPAILDHLWQSTLAVLAVPAGRRLSAFGCATLLPQ